MGLMNFFKNTYNNEPIEEEKDTPIGGFNNWKEALESMKNDQINRHKENISNYLEELINTKNINDFNIYSLNKIINEKAIYFEENKEILEKKYNEIDYDKLILKFSNDIINEYN